MGEASDVNIIRDMKVDGNDVQVTVVGEIDAATSTTLQQRLDEITGSTTGAVPSKPHWRRNMAAMVSRIGALAMACLLPRLCSSSPEVSMLIVTRSLSIRAMTVTSASSCTGAPNASEIAFAMRWVAAPE